MSPNEIRSLLVEVGVISDATPVAESDSLFEVGALDSLRLIEVVSAIEKRYGIRVEQDDLVPANFDSIENLCAYVSDRLASLL